MPRKTASRFDLQKEAEAAAEIKKKSPKKKKAAKKAAKKATKKKKKAAKKRTTRRVKDAIPERKRLVWVIYTATLREEARFPYDQRKEAEAKLKQLLDKGKRTYFLQPVKELISGEAAKPVVEDDDDDAEDAKKKSQEAQDGEGAETEDEDSEDEDSEDEEE